MPTYNVCIDVNDEFFHDIIDPEVKLRLGYGDQRYENECRKRTTNMLHDFIAVVANTGQSGWCESVAQELAEEMRRIGTEDSVKEFLNDVLKYVERGQHE